MMLMVFIMMVIVVHKVMMMVMMAELESNVSIYAAIVDTGGWGGRGNN